MSSIIRKINNKILYDILEKYKENEKGILFNKRNFTYLHMIYKFHIIEDRILDEGQDSYLHLENNKSKVTVDIDEKECILQFEEDRLRMNISDSIELQIIDVKEKDFIKWYSEGNFENAIFEKRRFAIEEIKPVYAIHKSTDVEIRRNDFNIYYEDNFLRFIKELYYLLYKQIKDDFSIIMINDFIKIELKEQLKFERSSNYEYEGDLYYVDYDYDEISDKMYFCDASPNSNCIRIEYIEELDENRTTIYLEDLSVVVNILNKGTSVYQNILKLKNKIDKEVREEKKREDEENREMMALTLELCRDIDY